MKRLKMKGWRLENLDTLLLCEAVNERRAEPAVRDTALRMLRGMDFPTTDKWSKNTLMGYKVRARKLISALLLENPEWYGLERIDPTEITEPISSTELADFCQVPVSRVYELARGAPGNGLPKPLWPLGRTLKGRGWKFPPEFARLYAQRLIE